jgi:hypothetical protein
VVNHHLNICNAGTIVDLKKRKTSLGVATGSHPTLNHYLSLLTFEEIFNFCSLHKTGLSLLEPELKRALLIDNKGVFRYFRDRS